MLLQALQYRNGCRSLPPRADLRALTTEAAGKLEILGLDGDTLGVDGSEVGVLEERDEVGCEESESRSACKSEGRWLG